jgi:hypothetical protein
MENALPFDSREVRWFFDGKPDRHGSLKHWFETVAPIPNSHDSAPPLWQGRLDDQPDIYLIIPGSGDMGIKWREGLFQIKGRVASPGIQVFCGRHQGEVERWVKWSYPDMPTAYKNLFQNGHEQDLLTVAVKKVRALRMLSIDAVTGEPEEVGSTTRIDRGLGIELTHIQVGDKDYCSLAVEAFPDDAAMASAFTGVVEAFLGPLTEVNLDASRSKSYPAWLNSITSGNIGRKD